MHLRPLKKLAAQLKWLRLPVTMRFSKHTLVTKRPNYQQNCIAPVHVWVDAPPGGGLWEPSNAPVSSPSRGSQGLRNLENRARTRMNTGVARIVTISCTDSDDARWRTPLAQKRG